MLIQSYSNIIHRNQAPCQHHSSCYSNVMNVFGDCFGYVLRIFGILVFLLSSSNDQTSSWTFSSVLQQHRPIIVSISLLSCWKSMYRYGTTQSSNSINRIAMLLLFYTATVDAVEMTTLSSSIINTNEMSFKENINNDYNKNVITNNHIVNNSIRLTKSIVDSNMQDQKIQMQRRIPLQAEEEEYQQHRDRRSLLKMKSVLDDVILCIPNGTITTTTDDNSDETDSTSSNLVEWSSYVAAIVPRFLVTYYTLRGGKEGNCIDNCQSLCNHQPCYHDTMTISNSECYCLLQSSRNYNDNMNDLYQCGDNTKCLSSSSGNNDICQCMPGYSGNPYMGCTNQSTPSNTARTPSHNPTTSITIYLKQSDFANGTFIVSEPGMYTLTEDITFCPYVAISSHDQEIEIPTDTFYPYLPNGDRTNLHHTYDEYAYTLGFFAAISVIGDNIVIDLNGYTIQQCEGHLLMQRFFALIELNSAPFTQGNGPHEFVGPDISHYHAAKNITIHGPGTLGRSAHHAIHGNDNSNVHIYDITFDGYEIAAVNLNNVQNVTIENCIVNGNRKDIPILGTFSAIINIRSYIQYLQKENYSMILRNQTVTANDLYHRLLQSIMNVYNDVMETGSIDQNNHPDEYDLYSNPFRVTEGTCYAFLIYGQGPASNGFALEIEEVSSSNVIIRNNIIRDMMCFTHETPTAINTDDKPIIDARGQVFQFYSTLHEKSIANNGQYQGNVLSDAQIMTAKAINDGIFDTSGNDPFHITNVSAIPKDVIDWAQGIQSSYLPKYRCNGDIMHHVSKGMVMIRVEETLGFVIEDNVINNILNVSPPPFANCVDYHELDDEENGNETQAQNVRGIHVSGFSGFANGTQNVVRNNIITNCFSNYGRQIIGIDVMGESSDILISGNTVNLHSMSSVLDVESSIYSALFVGEHLEFVEIDNNNTFKEKQVILNDSRSKRRHGRQLSKLDHEQHHDKKMPQEDNHNNHLRKQRSLLINDYHNSDAYRMLSESSSSSSKSSRTISNRGGCPMFRM